jgi:uncharacterized protein (TIGR03083 family)
LSSLADQMIAALRAGHDDLVSYLRRLSPEDLTRQSVATDWDVSQVISHLGSGAVIGLGGLEASLAGAPNPGMEFNKSVWARWNAMTPGERVENFPPASLAQVERFEGLDDATRESLRVDLGFLPQPVDVATAARFRLNEFALHSWDVRATFDPAATVRPEAVPLLLDHLTGIFGWVGKPAALAGRTATLAVTLSDPDRTFGLRIADGVTAVDVPSAPDGTLGLTAEAWLRLVSGRLRPEFTPSGVEVTGDVDLETLRRVFPGY